MTLANAVTVQGFNLNSADATLLLNGGAVLVTADTSFINAGTLMLNGGTLRGGTLNVNGGTLRFSNNGNNILDGVTVNGAMQLSASSAFARLLNGTSFSEADLTGVNSRLIVEGTTGTPSSTLSNALVNMNGSGAIFGLSRDITLTLDSSTTIRGMGSISSDVQFSGLGTLINQGLISSDVAGQTLTINPDVFTNEGTLQATNGATLTISSPNWTNAGGTLVLNNSTINLGGAFTDPGAINRSGGTINVTGTWNLSSYLLSETTGDFVLNGGTIRGGNLALDGGTLRFSNNGNNILDGVAINGAMQLSATSAFARLLNGTSFSEADLTGANSRLIVEGTTGTPSSTLSNALVNLNVSGAIFGLSRDMTLTLDSSTTIRGMGSISSDVQFSGLGTLINQGLISSDVAGQTLTINPDVFTNEGTLQATNGATLTISSPNWTNAGGTLVLNNSTINLGGAFTDPGAISRSGGTINVTGTWNLSSYLLSETTGDFVLNGGTIEGGSLTLDGGTLRFSNNGNNILDGVTVSGAMQLSASSAFARLLNGTSFSEADLTGANSRLIVEGTTGTPSSTLSNALVNMNGSGAIFGLSRDITLTLDSSTTIRGMGSISSDIQFSGLGTLINQGLILADISGQTLTINPDVFTNQGTLQAINGATLTISSPDWNNTDGTLVLNNSTINLGGTFTDPGAINRSGGTINVTGTWNLSSYLLSETTGDFVLNGGTIRGGNLALDGGTLRFSNNGNNILDGVAINGAMQLSATSAFARLLNGTSFSEADLTGANSRLIVEGTTGTPSSTLSNALVNLNVSGAIFGLSRDMTLTLDSSTTIRGMGSISSDVQFSGLGTLINQGLISSDVAGQTLTINPDVFTNEGTLQATNGATLTISSPNWTNAGGTLVLNNSTINLGGTFTDPGAINRSGGTINVTGTWNLGSYLLSETTGDFVLNGGTIEGGSLTLDGGTLRFSNNGNNILDGVTVSGAMQLSASSAFARLLNGTSFSEADLTGANSRLIVEGTTSTPSSSLSNATINMDASGATFGLSRDITLTLDSSTTIRGMGSISSDLQFSGLGTIINQGLISADLAGQTLTINPDVFTNEGTVRAISGGKVNFTTAYTQTAGSLEVAASTISANTALQINGGALSGYGQINAAIMNNAMLRPELGGSGLNVTGAVTLLSSSTLSLQIGGLIQGSQYSFLNVNGATQLGGSLVVSFVNSFEANPSNNFTVLNSTSALSGAFANVASGGRLQVSGSPGNFLVTYNGNAVVLSDYQTPPFQGLPHTTTPTVATSAHPSTSDDPRPIGFGRGKVIPRAGARHVVMTVQNSGQLLDLVEGPDATTTGGRLTVRPRRNPRTNGRQDPGARIPVTPNDLSNDAARGKLNRRGAVRSFSRVAP